jgi:YegS/Rv2252/BmrU family lipid kinase
MLDPQENKFIFIINPVSIHKQADLNLFIDSLNEYFRGYESNLFIYISKYPRDAISAIRQYIKTLDESVIKRIYAVGGDGILFDCLNGVVGLPNTELGSIPYGNSNDFVRAFGDGLNDQFRNIDNQVNGKSVKTDLIYCGNNYALNTCTIGMESYATHKSLKVHHQYRKFMNVCPHPLDRFVYNILFYISGVLSIKNNDVIYQDYQIQIDNQDFSGQYAIINIANGPCYGGDKCAAPLASPNDGYLDVILFKSTNVFEFISKGLDYLYGKFYKYPELISYYRAKEVVVRSKLPLLLQLDGEVFIDTILTVKIIPNALNFISINDYAFKKHTTPKFDESKIPVLS